LAATASADGSAGSTVAPADSLVSLAGERPLLPGRRRRRRRRTEPAASHSSLSCGPPFGCSSAAAAAAAARVNSGPV